MEDIEQPLAKRSRLMASDPARQISSRNIPQQNGETQDTRRRRHPHRRSPGLERAEPAPTRLNYKLQRRSDQHLEEQKELLELLQEEGAIRAKDMDEYRSIEYNIVMQAPGDSIAVPATEGREPVKGASSVQNIYVDRLLGSGGFGTAYKAELSHGDGKGLIPICLKRAKSRGWNALTKENDIFSDLTAHHHPYIIDRRFLCQSFNDIFLGLNYFDGLSLRTLIKTLGESPSGIKGKHLFTILQQQTDAIRHLQENAIFHCDIKPDNILYSEGTQMSKLIDFGLAVLKCAPGEIFKHGGGTTDYMAPERIVDSDLHEGSDLFGLGATLHHVVTLSPPWDSVEDVKAARKMKIEKQERRKKVQAAIKEEIKRFIDVGTGQMAIQDEIERYSDKHPGIISIISKMLSYHAASRPECDEILRELKAWPHNGDNHTKSCDNLFRRSVEYNSSCGTSTSCPNMALLLPSSTSSGTLHYSASGYEEVSPYCEGAVTATGDSIVQPLLSTPSQTGEQVEAVEPEVPESEFQTLPNDMIRPADDDNDEDEAF